MRSQNLSPDDIVDLNVPNYTHGVHVQGAEQWVQLSGQVGLRPDGSMSDDFDEQCRQAFLNIQACLRDADMQRVDLSGSDLCQADLRNANLTDANLCNADLRGADLSFYLPEETAPTGPNIPADLTRANLTAADLRDAKVTDEQLAQAASLKAAILPDGTRHE